MLQARAGVVGTWFEQARITFLEFVLFAYGWSHEISSVKWCRHELGWGPHTIVDWSNFLREVCADAIGGMDSVKIGGPGMTVEVDESLFTRVSNNWILKRMCGISGIIPELFQKAEKYRTAAPRFFYDHHGLLRHGTSSESRCVPHVNY